MTLPHLRQYIELAAPARRDLRGAELRPRLHHHRRRTRHRQPALLHLPDLLHRAGLRAGSAAGVVVVIGTIIIATLRHCAPSSRCSTRSPDEHAQRTARPLQRVGRRSPLHKGKNTFKKVSGTVHPTDRARKRSASRNGLGLTVLAWVVGLLFVAPVLWMVLTSFHSETDAATNPPSCLRPAEPGGLPLLLRLGPVAAAAQLADRERAVHGPGHPAGLPGRLRAVHPAGEEVDGRHVLLPLHQDAAAGGRSTADLPLRAGHRSARHASGC